MIPVLSLADGVTEEFVHALRGACVDVGFFYITDHGVSEEALQRALAAARGFFQQPTAQKETVSTMRSPHVRGWSAVGGERTAGKVRPLLPISLQTADRKDTLRRAQVDMREQIDIGPEADPVPVDRRYCPEYMCMRGHNQWPAEAALPGFHAAVWGLYEALQAVGETLMQAVAQALGQPPDYWQECGYFADAHTRFRMKVPPTHSASCGRNAHVRALAAR